MQTGPFWVQRANGKVETSYEGGTAIEAAVGHITATIQGPLFHYHTAQAEIKQCSVCKQQKQKDG